MKFGHYSKIVKSITILFFVSASLFGCATMHGVGEDIESAGDAVQDAADGE